jgi:hypothetical protein
VLCPRPLWGGLGCCCAPRAREGARGVSVISFGATTPMRWSLESSASLLDIEGPGASGRGRPFHRTCARCRTNKQREEGRGHVKWELAQFRAYQHREMTPCAIGCTGPDCRSSFDIAFALRSGMSLLALNSPPPPVPRRCSGFKWLSFHTTTSSREAQAPPVPSSASAVAAAPGAPKAGGALG